MKYIVLVGDGMADYPLKELDGKTPLEISKTPNMDFIASNGQVGLVKTIPDKMAPASDVANLSILGYDPAVYYTGRGPLEAKNLGIDLKDDEVAFRCNFITAGEDNLVDYSAGHITTQEAKILIELLNKKLGNPHIKFYSGVSYRNILIVNAKKLGFEVSNIKKIKCVPPHDIIGQRISKNLPSGKGAEEFIKLMEASKKILISSEINQVRIDLKENPANMIWLWGQGTKPNMPAFQEKYGIQGSIISAVDLVKGIGKTIGLEAIEVPGATGYYDTDYLAKAKYGLASLKDKDFIFIHVEATDEAGHNGDIRAKISAIENFDKLVVGTILKHFKQNDEYKIIVLPDHYTPISVRTHTADPVLFAIYGQGIEKNGIEGFSESLAKSSKLRFDNGYELMGYLMKHN